MTAQLIWPNGEVIPAHYAGLDDNANVSLIIAVERDNGRVTKGSLWARAGGRKPRFDTYRLAKASRGARYAAEARRRDSIHYRGDVVAELTSGGRAIVGRVDNRGIRRTERTLAAF